ncbi:MAG: hypothetical protein IJD68_08125 [Ruminococcus sp.]|nr:hypothetical protein [Ruminococcus sp.]
MSIFASVKNMINTYGNRVKIEKGAKVYFTKAFIQPLHYKNSRYFNDSITTGGFSEKRYYLYIGTPQLRFDIRENAVLTSNGKKYVVHNSDTYEFNNSALYVWAVLKPYYEQRRDDYDAASD